MFRFINFSGSCRPYFSYNIGPVSTAHWIVAFSKIKNNDDSMWSLKGGRMLLLSSFHIFLFKLSMDILTVQTALFHVWGLWDKRSLGVEFLCL